MGDYTTFIVATYSMSFAGLGLLALRSYWKLKATSKTVAALRQARKAQAE